MQIFFGQKLLPKYFLDQNIFLPKEYLWIDKEYKNTIFSLKKTSQRKPKNIDRYHSLNSSNKSQTYFQKTQIYKYILNKSIAKGKSFVINQRTPRYD